MVKSGSGDAGPYSAATLAKFFAALQLTHVQLATPVVGLLLIQCSVELSRLASLVRDLGPKAQKLDLLTAQCWSMSGWQCFAIKTCSCNPVQVWLGSLWPVSWCGLISLAVLRLGIATLAKWVAVCAALAVVHPCQCWTLADLQVATLPGDSLLEQWVGNLQCHEFVQVGQPCLVSAVWNMGRLAKSVRGLAVGPKA